MNAIVATIIVTYKNTPQSLEGIENSLSTNGMDKKDIYFSDNTKNNLGYSGGINRILKKILHKYDYFFIVNPDVIIKKDCLTLLVKALEKDKTIGIVGPKILQEAGKIWSLGGVLDKKRYSGGLIGYGKSDIKNNETKKSIDFISGTAMLINKNVFETIGFFAEEYFLYYEDVDFCLRAQKAGFNLAICPDAEITHFASSTIGINSPVQQYYMARNHMWIVEEFAPFSVKLHEFLRLPKTLFQARDKKYELLGIRDYFLRKKGRHDYWN